MRTQIRTTTEQREAHKAILDSTCKLRFILYRGMTIREARRASIGTTLKIDAIISRPDISAGSEIYLYTTKTGKPAYATFRGKSAKPEDNYYCRSLSDREASCRRFIESIESEANRKSESARKASLAKSLGHGFEVGTILTGSWGYDQTNVEFFQVVRVSTGAIWIQEIGQESVRGDASWAEDVVPDKGNLFGPVLRRIPVISEYGASVKLHDSCHLHRWNGLACYQSHYA